jgi:hypothetical protein
MLRTPARPLSVRGVILTTAAAALLITGPSVAAGASAAPAAASAHNSSPGDHAASLLPGAARTTHLRAAAPARTHTTPNPLLKELFADGGDDDQPDANVGALCQSFLGEPNPYAPIAPNVDAISGDTVVPVGSQAGCDAAQNETTLAQNPENPRNLVSGSNDYRVFNTREQRNDGSGYAYTSFDGGKTWTDVQLPHLTFQTGAPAPLSLADSAGDPSISFGPHNTVYYSNLVFSRGNPAPGGSQPPTGIVVSVSHNGGLTWGEPTIVHLDGWNPDGTAAPTDIFNDKEWVAADPHSGTVYVTWTQFMQDDAGNYLSSPIVVAKSTDYGQHFSAPAPLSPTLATFTTGITPFGSGSNPVVTNDGSLYVAYETSVCQTAACNAPTDHNAVVVATSHDGGASFTNQEAAFDFDFPLNQDTGRSTLTGENFRINAFPQLAYDRADDRLWITWADDRNGLYTSSGASIRTDSTAFVVSARAVRRGAPQWSAASAVGSGRDEVYPAIAAFGGDVAVSYYTRYYDPAGTGLDFAMVSGQRSSISRAPQVRLTGQTENPQVQFVSVGLVSGQLLQGVFIGDYTAIALGPDLSAHPVWTDFRGNPALDAPNQDVVTQAVPVNR